MSEVETGFRAYMKFVLKSKSALAALAIIIIIVGVAAYVSTWPPSIAFTYLHRLGYWESVNPTDAAPSWMAALDPSAYAPSLVLRPSSAKLVEAFSGLYVYNLSYRFRWGYGVPPSDVSFIYSANTTIEEMLIRWVKPSGSAIEIPATIGSTQASFDLVGVERPIISYIYQKTGLTFTTVTTNILAEGLFNRLEPSKIGPVERGYYEVNVTVVTSGPARFSEAEVRVLGNAYGLLGTDYYGRPIWLGLLLGLPNALEVGVVTSVLSVLIGAFVGGFAGYMGGKVDAGLNWFSMVILALPALPFLVVLGLMLRQGLSLMLEALLITFLSWPAYAVIARSAAQSIRVNAFVEADKLMGIPSYRVFFTHFLPRLVPFIVAYTVLGIPGGILMVETLAFIGIAPPNIVTWGGILDSAYANNAALNGWWWWVLFPGLAIVVVSMPFVVVGFAIERASFGGR